MPAPRTNLVIGPTFNREASIRLLEDCENQALWQCTDPQGLARRLKKWLHAGADPNTQNRTKQSFGSVLSKAVQWGKHPDVVQMLLDAGANPMWAPEREIDNRVLTGRKDGAFQGLPVDPLNVALDALAWLVADAEASGNCPKEILALEQNLAVVDVLLDAGADSQAPDPATCRPCMENFLIVVSENSSDLHPNVVTPLLPRLWRMLNDGELAQQRQTFALKGKWDKADLGWHRVGDVGTIKQGLQAYGRELRLEQTFPAPAAPARSSRL